VAAAAFKITDDFGANTVDVLALNLSQQILVTADFAVEFHAQAICAGAKEIDCALDVLDAVAMVYAYLHVLAVSHEILKLFRWHLPIIRVNTAINRLATDLKDAGVYCARLRLGVYVVV
jgi:hypothetical protein